MRSGARLEQRPVAIPIAALLTNPPRSGCRYYKPETKGLDFEGMCEDLKQIAAGSVVLLHACAHNPTGVDPDPSQWEAIAEIIKERNAIPFFDSAYQGYASGDLEKDAFAVRLFEQKGIEMLIAQVSNTLLAPQHALRPRNLLARSCLHGRHRIPPRQVLHRMRRAARRGRQGGGAGQGGICDAMSTRA